MPDNPHSPRPKLLPYSLFPKHKIRWHRRKSPGEIQGKPEAKLSAIISLKLVSEVDVLVKIETYFDGEFWCARGIGEDIFTQGNTLDELYQNIKEAVSVHYGETDEPITILTLSEVKLASAKAPTS